MPPAWVRGRGLAVYQLVFQAGVAGGAIVWGAIAANADIRTALLAAGAAMIALPVLAVLAGLRLGTIQGLDLTPTHGRAITWQARSRPIPGRCSSSSNIGSHPTRLTRS